MFGVGFPPCSPEATATCCNCSNVVTNETIRSVLLDDLNIIFFVARVADNICIINSRYVLFRGGILNTLVGPKGYTKTYISLPFIDSRRIWSCLLRRLLKCVYIRLPVSTTSYSNRYQSHACKPSSSQHPGRGNPTLRALPVDVQTVVGVWTYVLGLQGPARHASQLTPGASAVYPVVVGVCN